MSTSKQSFHDLINGNTPVLVDFMPTGAAPCKVQAPALKQLADRVGDGLRIIKIDIDRSRAAATKYQIQSVPTLILFNKGKIVWRKSGAQSLSALEGLVKPYIGQQQSK